MVVVSKITNILRAASGISSIGLIKRLMAILYCPTFIK